MVKAYTNYFGISPSGVVAFSWLGLNFLELWVQEEFQGFIFYPENKLSNCLRSWKWLKTILHFLCFWLMLGNPHHKFAETNLLFLSTLHPKEKKKVKIITSKAKLIIKNYNEKCRLMYSPILLNYLHRLFGWIYLQMAKSRQILAGVKCGI